MIEQFKELLLEANSGSEAFNSGINKANKKAVSALRRLLNKQSEAEVIDIGYFISYRGSAGGRDVMTGSLIVRFSEEEKIKEIKEYLTKYVLELAKKHNNRVDNVHIIAFNKV